MCARTRYSKCTCAKWCCCALCWLGRWWANAERYMFTQQQQQHQQQHQRATSMYGGGMGLNAKYRIHGRWVTSWCDFDLVGFSRVLYFCFISGCNFYNIQICIFISFASDMVVGFVVSEDLRPHRFHSILRNEKQ